MRRILRDRRRAIGVALVGVAVLVAVATVLITRSWGPQAKYTPENIPLGTMSAMSTQQIASLLVPDPGADHWCRVWATDDEWEEGNELRTLRHDIPADGDIPMEVARLMEESFSMPLSEWELQAIQLHRILFAIAGQISTRIGTGIEYGALVADVRYVTGGGSDKKRWELFDSAPIYRVSDGGVC